MRERWVLVKAFAAEYRKARKKEKGAILDRFIKASGYLRRYAARLLRNQGRRVAVGTGVIVKGEVNCRVRRRRRQIYDGEVQRELKRMWQMLDYLCGKRLVAHEGGNAQGDYAQTLNLTDVSTGWTELAAVPNKAQVWVFEALQRLRGQLPFPLLGLDCDNGSEFINNQLRRYCLQEQITLTRSRPLRKNDNCFVEQKNYSVVRRCVGYARYDREAEVQLLNRLYDRVRLYVNFFLPSHKLKEKIRQGSRVRKRYYPAQTPYQRVLASPEVSTTSKKKLRAQYRQLNPAELHRQIRDLQEKLLWSTHKKQRAGAAPLAEAAGGLLK